MPSSTEQNQDKANMQQQQPGSTSTGSGVHSEGGSPPGTQAAQQHQPQPSVPAAQLQAPLPQQGQQQQAQKRRLTIDDALSYLDQVKQQFGNQPHLYNEFLDIMKEFKLQTIDPSGVINRVSNLFRGYSDLIVGFNAFLPPGYEIEVQANGHQPDQAVTSLSTGLDPAAASQTAANSAADSPKPEPSSDNEPDFYLEFLDIMGESRSGNIDGPGAVNRVSKLFTDYSDIIVGYNIFIPPGYKIEVQANGQIHVHQPGQAVTSLSSGSGAAAASQTGANSAADAPRAVPSSTPITTPNVPQPQAGRAGGSHHSYNQQIPQPRPPTDPAQTMSSPPQAQHQQAANQPEEFNHAMNYVNKVKDQFQNQPNVYLTFLLILHTYQNEPLTEYDVYQLVSILFQNHEDLLEEFKQFLPDAHGSGSGGLFGLPPQTQPPAKE